MSELLEILRLSIQQVILMLGYLGIAVVMFVESVVPPIPSELVMPFAGFLVAEGRFSFFGVWVAGTSGAVSGAVLLYYVGLWSGNAVQQTFANGAERWLFISKKQFDRAHSWFERHGEWVILFGRLIPMIRSLISIPAGMSGMNMGRFLIFTLVGTSVWNAVLTYTGFVLGENWEQILTYIDKYEQVTIGVTLVGVIWLAVVRLLAALRNRRLLRQKLRPAARTPIEAAPFPGADYGTRSPSGERATYSEEIP